MQDQRLIRLDASRLTLNPPAPFPVRIFANSSVPVEPAAVDELRSVAATAETLERLAPGEWSIERIAVTPDFHKGAGIPIGTVIETQGAVLPQATGSDINCGMRLHTTDLPASAVRERLDEIESRARHLYFEGGRRIPMTGRDREALLTGGLAALFDREPGGRLGGQWGTIERQGWHRRLDHVEARGSLAGSIHSDPLRDWTGDPDRVSRDAQIGSIGGGNHFVEIQRVARIIDRQTAYAWGLRTGCVAIMVHSGSVSIGHLAWRLARDLAERAYPRGMRRPENGIFPLGLDTPEAKIHEETVSAAANFAFANRMFLAASAVEALEAVAGEVEARLLYDSPHNFVWRTAEGRRLHRKGATPARGPEAMEGTPFHGWGEPVLVPGSMGASSFVLAGLGLRDALDSASHGAGRALSRGDASRSGHREFDDFLANFRVVTPLDFRRPETRRRADIWRRKIEELRAEGPHAYKGIRAIIDTLAEAGIAKPVAELVPLMTIKG